MDCLAALYSYYLFWLLSSTFDRTMTMTMTMNKTMTMSKFVYWKNGESFKIPNLSLKIFLNCDLSFALLHRLIRNREIQNALVD